LTRLVAGNRLFAAVLVPALLLRVDAELGYRWQAWFNDSFTYAQAAATLKPELTRPSGYSVYLWLLSAPAHGYLLVTVSQHLMGLGVAALIYALARHRFGAPAWVAVLATLPVLYDGYEIQLEHLIMSDTLFLFLAMAAVTILLWSPRPSWRACLAAGLLLGLSSTVRSTGLPLVAVFLLYLLIRLWPGPIKWRSLPSGPASGSTGGRSPGEYHWRRLTAGLAACVIAFAVPLAGYAGWFQSTYGQFALTDSTGVFLYSRVMTFADCSDMSLPASLRPLCATAPPDQRPIAQDYIWTSASPLRHLGHPEFSPVVNQQAKRFAVKAIEAQPLDYLRAAWDDTVRSFDWNRSVFPDAATYAQYQFGDQVKGSPVTVTVSPFAPVIRDYQRYVWLPGTVFGLILLAGLVLGVVRRRLTQILVPWLSSLALIVVPAATAEFDYRYVTTAVPFACLALAVALGSARLARDSAGSGPDRGLADTRHDERNLTADAT
jgi:hypothetical protein